MKVCSQCGKEFDVSTARRSCGRSYGAGVYNEYFSDGNACEDCAIEVISADYATGAELCELMGRSWDD